MTESERTERLRELEVIRDFLVARCRCVAPAAVAALEAESRDTFEKIVGLPTLESFVIAQEEKAVLWADEVVVGLLARADFGVTTLSTQGFLRRFVASGALSEESFDLATAKLAAWHYSGITWNASTVFRAGQCAQWDVDAWPFRQCIALMSGNSSLRSRAVTCLEFFRLLRRSDCSDLRQGIVVRANLNALRSRSAVTWMMQQVNDVFRVDFVSAQFVFDELRLWLSLHVTEA